MQIEITKQVPQVDIIEVELPYYYKHDLMSDHGDSVIYGKIEEKLCTSIQESKDYAGESKYEITKAKHFSIKKSGLAPYFDKEHKSSQEEFEEAKERCLLFLIG